MPPYFHVSSSANRESIARHGLDVARMGAAPGIAGSARPEVQGCFLADNEWEADFFVDMGRQRGPVDVWRVDGVVPDLLIDNGHGFFYCPGSVAADRLTLLRPDARADTFLA